MQAKLLTLFEAFVLIGILTIDQISKMWAQQHDLVIMNHGGVFGVLPSSGWVVLLTMILGFVVYEWRLSHGLERWGMGLLLVGGLGNIIDRFIFGSVRDFIYYPWFGFYGNVADIVLGVGVGIVIVSRLINLEGSKKKEEKSLDVSSKIKDRL